MNVYIGRINYSSIGWSVSANEADAEAQHRIYIFQQYSGGFTPDPAMCSDSGLGYCNIAGVPSPDPLYVQ